METIPKVVVHTIEAGGSAFPLAEGKPIDLGVDVDAYMDEQRNAGLIIIQDGQIRLETYKLGYGPEGRWTRSEEHTSELQSLMRNSYAVFCLKKKNITTQIQNNEYSRINFKH